MATPKPAPKKPLPADPPLPADYDPILDPDTDEYEEADTFGLEFSEITGEWYDPEFETAEEATGIIAHYDRVT